MVEVLFVSCVLCDPRSPHLTPINARATDLTPLISRRVVGMPSTYVAGAL